MRFLLALMLGGLFIRCADKDKETVKLFTDVAESSGVIFRNDLSFTKDLNPYTYRNFYNGAGVAIGDINNDGLQDIYLTGNQVDNKLFLNLGSLKFKDISKASGTVSNGSWSTGVT